MIDVAPVIRAPVLAELFKAAGIFNVPLHAFGSVVGWVSLSGEHVLRTSWEVLSTNAFALGRGGGNKECGGGKFHFCVFKY